MNNKLVWIACLPVIFLWYCARPGPQKTPEAKPAISNKPDTTQHTADSISGVRGPAVTGKSPESEPLSKKPDSTSIKDSLVVRADTSDIKSGEKPGPAKVVTKKRPSFPLICKANPGSAEGSGVKGEYILQGDVKCDYGRLHFETAHAIWNRRANQVNCSGGTKVLIDALVLTSEEGGYHQPSSTIWATGKVRGVDTTGTYEFLAGRLDYHRDKQEMLLTNQPILRKIYTRTKAVADSFAVPQSHAADTLEIRAKIIRHNDSLRETIAKDDVIIIRGAMVVRCSSAVFVESSQTIHLMGKPVAKLKENEMKGNTMTMLMEGEAVKSMAVKGDAVADYLEDAKGRYAEKYHLKGDSLLMTIEQEKMEKMEIFEQGLASHINTQFPKKENEMTGKYLRLDFNEEKIADALVVGNAKSTYFYFDANEFKGKNIADGDSLNIQFDKGKVAGILITGKAKGTYLGQPATKKDSTSPPSEPDSLQKSNTEPKK